jgi:hypothetical protein
MNEIAELAKLLETPKAIWLYFLAVLLFGFLPGFTLRLMVKLYPPGDERRKVLLADMYELPRHKRWFFVAEQLETVLIEGLPERIRQLPLIFHGRASLRALLQPERTTLTVLREILAENRYTHLKVSRETLIHDLVVVYNQVTNEPVMGFEFERNPTYMEGPEFKTEIVETLVKRQAVSSSQRLAAGS